MLPGVEVTTPIEPVLPRRILPWEHGGNVTFCLDVGPLRMGATEEEKLRAATQYLSALQQCAVRSAAAVSLNCNVDGQLFGEGHQ